jgi:hypothetical protein
MDAHPAPAALPGGAKKSDASVGSDLRGSCEGGVDDNAEDRACDVLCTVWKERCRRGKLMTDTTAVRDEVAIAALDQQYASLR